MILSRLKLSATLYHALSFSPTMLSSGTTRSLIGEVPNAIGLWSIVAATLGATSGEGLGMCTVEVLALLRVAGASSEGGTSWLTTGPGPPFWPPTRPKPL